MAHTVAESVGTRSSPHSLQFLQTVKSIGRTPRLQCHPACPDPKNKSVGSRLHLNQDSAWWPSQMHAHGVISAEMPG